MVTQINPMAENNSTPNTNDPKPPSWATSASPSDPQPASLQSSPATPTPNTSPPSVSQNINLNTPTPDPAPSVSESSTDTPVVDPIPSTPEPATTNLTPTPVSPGKNTSTPFTPPTDVPENPLANLNTAGLSGDENASAAIQTQFTQMDNQSPDIDSSTANPSNQASDPVPTTPANADPATPGAPPPPPSFTNNITPSDGDKPAGDKVSFNKKNPIMTIVTILLVLAILGGLAFVVVKFVLPMIQQTTQSDDSTSDTTADDKLKTESVTLTYWGLWEQESVMKEVFDEFESTHPGLTIRYESQDKDSYRTRLQTAIDAGVGPDIFRMHNTWLPMLKNKIQPDTDRKIDLSEYYPVVSRDLAISGVPFAVPIGFDTLALYYNPELFQKAGQQPPKTWDQLIEAAKAITTKDEAGNIQISGIALGDTASIANFSDIIGLMIYQQGGDPAKPTSESTKIAVEAYTAFATKSSYKFWSDSLGDSIYAFSQGKVGMIFAPSWRAFEIESINPSLEFKTIEVPQLGGSKVGWATYWAETVSKESKNTDLAWELLAFMSEDENLIKLYQAQSQLRGFGEIYPKPSLASSFDGEEIVSAFASQGAFAQSWYLSSRTFDNGINDNIIKYYEDAVNTIIARSSDIDKALVTAEAGVTQTLSKYGIE